MTPPELAPCPCGNGAPWMFSMGQHAHRYQCRACTLCTAFCATEAEAVLAWNHLAVAGEMERILRRIRDRGLFIAVDLRETNAVLARLAPAPDAPEVGP